MTSPFDDVKPGRVYWVTGLAGAGKTTIARALYAALRAREQNVVMLDGDILREAYGDTPGHHREARLAMAQRHARMCRMLSRQGIDVIIATISMFHEIHQWNRAELPGYIEIFVDVPMEILIARDQKSLYSRALAGELSDVVGVDQPAELPEAPHVRLVNDGTRSVDAVLTECLQKLGLE